MLKKFLLFLFLAFTTSACLEATTTTPTFIAKIVLNNTTFNHETQNLASETEFCTTVTAPLALHDGPNVKARVISYLRKGDQIMVIPEAKWRGTGLSIGNWWKIQVNRLTGYAQITHLQKGCT